MHLYYSSARVGLRTAVELTRRNIPVVLRSPRHPLDISGCSQGAGGLWMPFHCDDPRTDRWAIETLGELHPMTQDRDGTSTTTTKKNPLVELVPTVVLRRDHGGPDMDDFLHPSYKLGTGEKSPLPAWSTDPRLKFQHLTVEMLWWQNYINKLKIPTQDELVDAGYKHAWFFQAPIVDPPKMMQNMLEELEGSNKVDVNVETGVEYESVDDMMDEAKRLNCDGVLNCTGLGASKLCNDEQMIGARGVLLHYDRETCIRRSSMNETDLGLMQNDANIMTEDAPWGSGDLPCYLIARGNTIVVGGSYLEGDTETKLRPEERERLLQNAKLVGIDTERTQPVGEWVGFRPYRPTSRCEVDPKHTSSDIRLVHSYGYGGSGWTVYVGCAKEATKLLLDA
jgi:D-amino-acid oxidase